MCNVMESILRDSNNLRVINIFNGYYEKLSTEEEEIRKRYPHIAFNQFVHTSIARPRQSYYLWI
jgi:hypothetical protein